MCLRKEVKNYKIREDKGNKTMDVRKSGIIRTSHIILNNKFENVEKNDLLTMISEKSSSQKKKKMEQEKNCSSVG